MKRTVLAFGLALAASIAQAGIIQSVEDAGVYTTQVAGATTVNWNDYSCGAYANCYGDGALVTGSSSGRYASPYGISSAYLTVPYNHSAGAVTLRTPGSYNYFGLYWGSLDLYNSIHFYSGGSLVGSYDGGDIAPLLATGGQSSWASNRYVNFLFTDGDLFDRIVLVSTNWAFESDNHAFGNIAAAVPEPGTLAMFGLGLMGLGGMALRRQAAR
ncbi:MAG TPA: PEP-CTERM sorting domain-containing protein [Steroidobacteraceae bacterium]|nr:PEP-CTERM sorting domain-containing protein [Steroidobacteraceae bacterium]